MKLNTNNEKEKKERKEKKYINFHSISVLLGDISIESIQFKRMAGWGRVVLRRKEINEQKKN